MKKLITSSMLALALVLVFTSCSKGPKAPDIQGYATYTDPATGLSFEYPANWVKTTNPIRFVAFNDNSAKSRFARYDTEGFPGAKIDINIYEMDSTKNLDTVLVKSEKFTKDTYEQSNTTVSGLPAKKLTYTFQLASGVFYGETYAIQVNNTTANIIQFECFDGTYDKYKEAFDKLLQSFKPGNYPSTKPDTINKTQEGPLPSATLITKNGMGYSIKVPDNFSAERGPSKGVLESKNFIGTRRADCNIMVDVIDASKNKKLDNIVNDFKANYKNATPQKINMSGKDAYVMNYTLVHDVLSRVYFVINGTKLYRITMNWYKGEEKDYLPIFEKCIASFKLE